LCAASPGVPATCRVPGNSVIVHVTHRTEVPMATPPRKKAEDFDPEVLRLFDRYVHGLMDRRAFLAGAARFAVGATTAAGLLAALAPKFALAQQVKPDDRRLRASYLDFPSPDG